MNIEGMEKLQKSMENPIMADEIQIKQWNDAQKQKGRNKALSAEDDARQAALDPFQGYDPLAEGLEAITTFDGGY